MSYNSINEFYYFDAVEGKRYYEWKYSRTEGGPFDMEQTDEMKCTWSFISERAWGEGNDSIDWGCVRAKDEARWAVGCLALNLYGHDLELDECPEESVELFTDELEILFDIYGNLLSYNEELVNSSAIKKFLEEV